MGRNFGDVYEQAVVKPVEGTVAGFFRGNTTLKGSSR